MPTAVENEGTTRRPRPAAPKPGPAEASAPEDGLVGLDLAPVGLATAERKLKRIPATVVYLGTNRAKSISLRGTMSVTAFEDEETSKTVELREPMGPESGNSSYDFSSHDARHRPISSRLFPVQKPGSPAEHLSGRPRLEIDHPMHLWDIFQMTAADGSKEFEILAEPQYRAELRDFFMEQARKKRQGEHAYEETQKNT